MADRSFPLGRLLATPAALAALAAAGQAASEFLDRHRRGDWGEVDAEDKRLNDQAVAHEQDDPARRGRVLSAYRTRLGVKLWVITEHDRSATTVLLPEDY